MMLFQTGQMGLFRTVFNPGLPPSVVAGGTFWIDANDENTLYTETPNTGGTIVTTDGGDVGVALNKVRPTTAMRYGAGRPTRKLNAVNGVSSLVCTGYTYMGTIEVAGGGATPPGDYITTTIKNMVVGVKVNAADAYNAIPYSNRMIVGESNGYWGLHVYDAGDGTNLVAQAYNYGGGASQESPNVAAAKFPKGQWVILTYQHQASSVKVRVNGGAWASNSSGATDNLGASLQIGPNGYNTASDMEVQQLMVMNTTQTDATLSYCEQHIANDLGILPWW